jgi:hypothetical protein
VNLTDFGYRLQADHRQVLSTPTLVTQDMINRTTPRPGKATHFPVRSSKDTERQIRSTAYPSDVTTASYSPIAVSTTSGALSDTLYSSTGYNTGNSSAVYGAPGPSYASYPSQATTWEPQGRISPETYADDYAASPNSMDYPAESSSRSSGKSKSSGKGHSAQRRPSNRDEFDGPHQFLQRPSPEYIAQQERDLPHLPTNLVVQEQDSVLTQVNDRLSQCAFDFVAKWQFPIPASTPIRTQQRRRF